MSQSPPHTLIQDDGELVDIRAQLHDLGVEYEESHKDEATPLPTHLLISSGTHAVATLKRLSREGRSHNFLHLVVVDRASRSLRQLLGRHGCDMVAPQPVHPTVIRLLVQRAHYRGEEHREIERVAIGAKVRVRAGLVARSATLGELSERGCGLVMASEPAMGSKLRVTLPSDFSGGKAINLTAKVVGARRLNAAMDRQYSVAVVFVGITRDLRMQIARIMRERAQGRTGMLEAAPGTRIGQERRSVVAALEKAAVSSQLPPVKSEADLRDTPRHAYDQSVLARADDSTHTLLGRDLSVGGMRVGAEQGLKLGSRLQLAIYGNAGVPPVIVTAVVMRDDGADGLGLRFESLPAPAQKRLSKIVEGLALLQDPGSLTGTVVSEVLNPV